MTMPNQPGWYDDPDDSNAQRYWDGQDWTPHRQRKSTLPSARSSTPPPPPSNLPPPPLEAPPPSNLPPPPLQAPPPSNLPPPPQQAPPPSNLPPPPPNLPPPPANYDEGAGQGAGVPTQPPPPAWFPPPPETGAGVGQMPSASFATVQGAVKQLGATAWLLIGGLVAATISIFLTWETVTQSVTVFGTTVGSQGTVGTSSGGRFALLVPIVAAAWLAWPVFAGSTMSPRRLMGLSAVVGLMVLSVPLWFAVFRDNDASAGIKSSYGFGLLLFSAAVIVIAGGVVRLWMLRSQGQRWPS